MTIVSETSDEPMIVRTVDTDQFVRVNASFHERTGFDNTVLAKKPFLEWIIPEDLELAQAALNDGAKIFFARHIARDGSGFPLRIQVAGQGDELFILGRYAETPPQPDVFERSSEEATVLSTLDAIARIIEEQSPGYKCSILLVADGHFVSGAGPSLPDEYNSAIDGYAVGPNVGSCGTAIFWNLPVIVEDIQADPLWTPFAELAKKAGVASCWSHPFVSKGGKVLGALAFYSPEPCSPTPEQLRQLKAAARLTGLSVERGRAEEALREKRKRELELEGQLMQLEKMKALGFLAGGIAHDFKNQLQPIIGFADILAHELEDERHLEFVESILQAMKHSNQLVSDLLTFARKDQVFESVPIDIHKSVSQVIALLKHSINKNIHIHKKLNAFPSIIEGEPTQIQNMILNIALNARDAMPKGGDLIFSTVIVELKETTMMPFNPSSGSYIQLQISDTGTGMDEETLQRVFEPFFTTKKEGEGTGMGLSCVYGAVEKHKGTIAIESSLEKGTALTIYIPTSATL